MSALILGLAMEVFAGVVLLEGAQEVVDGLVGVALEVDVALPEGDKPGLED